MGAEPPADVENLRCCSARSSDRWPRTAELTFHHAKLIAQNRSELVVFGIDRRPQPFLQLHLLAGWQLWHQGVAHASKELHLVGLLERFGLARILKGSAKVIDSPIKRRQPLLGLAGSDRLLRLAARPHHKHLRAEVLQHAAIGFGFAELAAQVKRFEVAAGVADDSGII